MKDPLRAAAFLQKLADLCDEYKPDFFYTIDDDGVHIEICGLNVWFNDSPQKLRDAANKMMEEFESKDGAEFSNSL